MGSRGRGVHLPSDAGDHSMQRNKPCQIFFLDHLLNKKEILVVDITRNEETQLSNCRACMSDREQGRLNVNQFFNL